MLTEDGEIKLIDFGVSKTQNDGKKLKTIAGTYHYMAPEILEGKKYDSKCDIWSLGVLLYTLLSGYSPFEASTRNDMFYKIKAAKFTFDHPEFADVSEDAKDLI